MAADNDVNIVRVYTREVGGDIEDNQFLATNDFEVVVEAEAGTAIFNLGPEYSIGVTVRNLTDSSINTHNDIHTGRLGDATWPTQPDQEVFGPFSPDWGAGQSGVHIYEVLAYAKVGNVNPDVSITKSHLFAVYKDGQP